MDKPTPALNTITIIDGLVKMGGILSSDGAFVYTSRQEGAIMFAAHLIRPCRKWREII
jgi:hypothetical protein